MVASGVVLVNSAVEGHACVWECRAVVLVTLSAVL
jgi:hypothetical protein